MGVVADTKEHCCFHIYFVPLGGALLLYIDTGVKFL